jgi:hypothetical protein
MADGVVVGNNQYSVDNDNTGINFSPFGCQFSAHTILFTWDMSVFNHVAN